MPHFSGNKNRNSITKQTLPFHLIRKIFLYASPVLFFLLATWFVFSYLQKSGITLIEEYISENKWDSAEQILKEELENRRFAMPRLLLYGSIIEFARNGLSDKHYTEMLQRMDPTGIFIEESFLRRMELFSNHPDAIVLATEYLRLYKPRHNAMQILRSVTEQSSFDTAPTGFSAFFSNHDAFTLLRTSQSGKVFIRNLDSQSGEITGEILPGKKVLTGAAGSTETIGGKNGTWRRILSENGETGWVFDANLTPIRED